MHPALKFPPDPDPSGISIRPVFMPGDIVQLEPLSQTHVADLTVTGYDPTVWQFLFDAVIYEQWGMPTFVFHLLECQKRGTDLPFAIIDKRSRMAVGITRYLHIDKQNKRLEIATWITTGFRGTGLNTESKYLLLHHAFKVLGFNRVEFNIDKRNTESIDAIEKMGITCETNKEIGLRDTHILSDESRRTSVVYAVTSDDWKSRVKATIKAKLEEHARSSEEQQWVAQRMDVLTLMKAKKEEFEAVERNALKELERNNKGDGFETGSGLSH